MALAMNPRTPANLPLAKQSRANFSTVMTIRETMGLIPIQTPSPLQFAAEVALTLLVHRPSALLIVILMVLLVPLFIAGFRRLAPAPNAAAMVVTTHPINRTSPVRLERHVAW